MKAKYDTLYVECFACAGLRMFRNLLTIVVKEAMVGLGSVFA